MRQKIRNFVSTELFITEQIDQMTLKPYVAKVWVRVRILPAHLLSWQRYLSNGHLLSQTYHSRRFLGVNRGRINQETFVGQRIERELESGVRAPVL